MLRALTVNAKTAKVLVLEIEKWFRRLADSPERPRFGDFGDQCQRAPAMVKVSAAITVET